MRSPGRPPKIADTNERYLSACSIAIDKLTTKSSFPASWLPTNRLVMLQSSMYLVDKLNQRPD